MTESNLIITIISALGIVGASFVSGFFLLRSHHSKVRQEIKIHRENELFDRKQKAYRELLKVLSRSEDYSNFLGTPINWKIIRYFYDEIMLIGSKEVIEKTNELLSDESPNTKNSDKIMKQLWYAIRKDLYDEKISIDNMKMIRPSPKTIRALALHNVVYFKLKSLGIDTIAKTREMDVDDINKKSQIDKSDLNLIKEMAKEELENENELKRFLEDI